MKPTSATSCPQANNTPNTTQEGGSPPPACSLPAAGFRHPPQRGGSAPPQRPPPVAPENHPADGRGFSRKGKTLLSAVDPKGRAERTADSIPAFDRTLYLCPSPLYGYGLERLLARLAEQAPNSAVLCLEADKELFTLAHNSFSEALRNNSRLRLTDKCDAAALCVLVRQVWGARTFRRVELIRLSGGWQLFPALYDDLAAALRRDIAVDWGNALTLTKLGRRYIRNALRNLARIPHCPSVQALSFGSSPALVLGAGPSLDATLDSLSIRFGGNLQQAEKRPFKIICVDTCLPALRARNIRPDLAVILESQHWNLGDFIGVSGWGVPAAMDLSALPRSGNILGGGLFLFFTPWTELRLFERLNAAALLPATLAPLGSVGLSAVEIARRLCGGTIVIAGIDFSFTFDSYHARSTPGHRDKLHRHSRFAGLLNPVPAFAHGVSLTLSKTGQPVRSNPAMRNYRSLFEREFATDTRIFDIAGSGLPLGLKTLSIDEAGDILGKPAAGETIPPCPAPPIPVEKLRTFISGEQDRLTQLRDMLAGAAAADQQRLNTLIDECDYLWAHFPDYAAAGGRRPAASEIAGASPAAISFLKRLRAEIDPFLELLAVTVREI